MEESKIIMGKGIEGYSEVQNNRLRSIDESLKEIKELLKQIVNNLPESKVKEKKTLLND